MALCPTGDEEDRWGEVTTIEVIALRKIYSVFHYGKSNSLVSSTKFRTRIQQNISAFC
jgi:hypothetical protein